jgi:hypothetical protein
MRRVCPACSTRSHQLIDPECVLCTGTGHIVLGAAALSIHDAVVAAEAVGIALEAAAREADTTLTLTDDRVTPILDTLAMLALAGIIDHTPPVTATAVVVDITAARARRRAPRPLTAGEQLAFDFTGLWPEPQDRRVITARPHVYTEHDRPHARGLPTLSANGHPSHLARILDPAEPGTNTRIAARARRRDTLHAQALFEAGHLVAKRKTRKQKAAA